MLLGKVLVAMSSVNKNWQKLKLKNVKKINIISIFNYCFIPVYLQFDFNFEKHLSSFAIRWVV